MDLPPGRVADLVLLWLGRAQEGEAGELLLWLGPDGEIVVEERWARPYKPTWNHRRGGDGSLPPDDPPARQLPQARGHHLETGAELDAILRLRPGELESWREDVLQTVLPQDR